MLRILFVCTANQFRSPLAAALFEMQLQQHGDALFTQVSSAGTWAQPGLPVPDMTLNAAKELNLNGLMNHRTRPINLEMLNQTDLVLVMEAHQKEAIQIEFPAIAGKTFLLTEICTGKIYDIPDPMKTDASPAEIASEIASYIDKGYQLIISKAQEMSKQP